MVGVWVASYDQSRISRDVKDFHDFMALCEQQGVLVFQVLGGLIRTDNEWSWGMRAFAASMQRKETKKKVLAGTRRLKEQGRVLGKIPVGYLRVNKLLVTDPEWAPRVVIIFELYSTGRFSFETLARHLNDDLKLAAPLRKWRTKDGEWHGDNQWHVDGLKNMLQSGTDSFIEPV